MKPEKLTINKKKNKAFLKSAQLKEKEIFIEENPDFYTKVKKAVEAAYKSLPLKSRIKITLRCWWYDIIRLFGYKSVNSDSGIYKTFSIECNRIRKRKK